MAARLFRLLDNRDDTALSVELRNSVTLGVIDRMNKDSRALLARSGLAQMFGQPMAKKHIVAEHERRPLAVEEFRSDDEGFGETAWFRLLRVIQLDAPLRPVPE